MRASDFYLDEKLHGAVSNFERNISFQNTTIKAGAVWISLMIRCDIRISVF